MRMPQRKQARQTLWHTLCRLGNTFTFTMTHFLASGNRMGATLALVALVLSTSAAFGQRRGNFLKPRRAGALELTGASLLSQNNEGNLMVDAGLEVTVLGRAAGPLHSGVRLSVGILDRTGSISGTEAGTTERRRTLLPEVSGVLRLDPFRGGFRPFAEAELGMSATLIDIRTFDETGHRTDYACLLYTSPSPRDATLSRMPSSA